MARFRLGWASSSLATLLAFAAALRAAEAPPAAPPVPAGAAALGYTVKVLDEHPTVDDIAPNNANSGKHKWFNGAWWDAKRPPLSLYGTTDGALTIRYDPEADVGGCLIGTPRDLSAGALPWLDGAKGFYIEFDTRLSDNDPSHWPAVWVMPVEHSGGSGKPPGNVYAGDPEGFERWLEIDIDEGGLAKSGGAMASAISWWGRYRLGGFKSDIANNWATGIALDRTKLHTFGASYDPVKRQVTSWLDGKQQWQTPVGGTSVPPVAAKQHFYPILSVWRVDGKPRKPYSMVVSGVRAYAPAQSPQLPNTDAEADVATAASDWCVLTYPKTCSPGKEFEIKVAVRDAARVTKGFTANKLAVHLWGGTADKWGGYLGHFASAVVDNDGLLTLKGKLQTSDATAAVEIVQIQAYLTDSWANDKTPAAEFRGPKMEVVK